MKRTKRFQLALEKYMSVTGQSSFQMKGIEHYVYWLQYMNSSSLALFVFRFMFNRVARPIWNIGLESDRARVFVV